MPSSKTVESGCGSAAVGRDTGEPCTGADFVSAPVSPAEMGPHPVNARPGTHGPVVAVYAHPAV